MGCTCGKHSLLCALGICPQLACPPRFASVPSSPGSHRGRGETVGSAAHTAPICTSCSAVWCFMVFPVAVFFSTPLLRVSHAAVAGRPWRCHRSSLEFLSRIRNICASIICTGKNRVVCEFNAPAGISTGVDQVSTTSEHRRSKLIAIVFQNIYCQFGNLFVSSLDGLRV